MATKKTTARSRTRAAGVRRADAPAPAASGAGASSALDALFTAFDRSDAPGLAVGVAQHGKVLLRRGYGLASFESGRVNTPTTRFRIGSATKHFTCLAVLLLAEEGRVDIEAPIDRWFPELAYPLGVPVVRQLMDHTSGLRCYLDVAGAAAALTIQPRGMAYQTQVRQTRVNFAPGHGQIYCNGGYHLLSMLVDRVAGMPFERFLSERIFAPLGMHDTLALPSDLALVRGMATLHLPDPTARPIPWRRGIFVTEEVRGEGSIVSTVDDMLKWLVQLRGPERQVGTAATWDRLTTPGRLASGLATPYALGLLRHRYRGVEVLQHSGAVMGGLTQMLTVPAHGLDVIIMTNGVAASPTKLAWSVLDTVLGDALPEPPGPRLATSRKFATLVGTQWANDEGLVLGFDDVAGKLGVSLLFSKPAPLLRDEGRQLRVAFEDVVLGPFTIPTASFRTGSGQRAPAALQMEESGRATRFVRLPRRGPGVAAVAGDLVGAWRSDELDADGRIALEDGKLVLRLQGVHGEAVVDLEPVTRDLLKMSWRGDPTALPAAMTVCRAPGTTPPAAGARAGRPARATSAKAEDGAGRIVELRFSTLRSRGLSLTPA